MNRSWFRNPFSGNSSKGMGEDGDEQAEEEANADGELPVSMGDRSNGSSGWNTKKRKRRAKAGGQSDTSATTNNSYSDMSGQSSEKPPPLPNTYGNTTHAAHSSLHSISSIRTAHFAQSSSSADRHERPKSVNSPDGSMEASPSKTPVRDRMSWASTASGMIGFDDEDREEAELRWQAELEEAERQEEEEKLAYRNNASTSSRIRLVGALDGQAMTTNEEEEEERRDSLEVSFERAARLTPSRSSTSLKSILKRANASELPDMSAAARTVTFSPSAHPPAASPPLTTITPEHPRPFQAAAAEDDTFSPIRHTYVDDSNLLSPNESKEVEAALLSRSTPENSSDSLRLQGSTSKRGAGFLNRMQALVPSPDSSFAHVKGGNPAQQENVNTTNLHDVSAPSRLHDLTTAGDETQRLRMSTGPRPLLLRQSVIMEETSSMLDETSKLDISTRRHASHPSGLPPSYEANESVASPPQAFHSFDVSQRTPAHAEERSKKRRTIGYHSEPGSTSMDELGRLVEETVYLTPRTDAEASETLQSPSPSPPPQASRPAITPSSSASSVKPPDQHSPFTSLVTHLVGAQEELLSHRADQKTLLLSLINNLRGELASRDRQLDHSEKQRKASESRAAQEKTASQQTLQNALAQIERTKTKLAEEIQRRDARQQAELRQEKARAQKLEDELHEFRNANSGLQEQLSAAEMHVSKLSTALEEAEVQAEEAERALEHEREERHQRSTELESATAQQSSYARDAVRLAEKEAEIDSLHRVVDERTERTTFLEQEVIRLRETIGKMRMESADRDVKVSRLVKTRDQLREDVAGLNIALEAKQHEVMMLKRPMRSRPTSYNTNEKENNRYVPVEKENRRPLHA